MKITKIHNVHQLTFLGSVFPINCYLYEEEHSLILIDTGMPFCLKGILRAADSIGKPIRKIVLTHPHQDHVGCLDLLAEQLTGIEVYMSERDAKLLDGDDSILEGEADLPIKGSFHKGLKTKPDIFLNDKDRIGSMKVISMPGHTPGSLALYEEENGIFIAGDALQVKGGMAVAGDMRLFFPFPAMATWNKKLAIESVEKAGNLEINYLAAGHGKIIENPVPLMKLAVKRAKEKLKRG